MVPLSQTKNINVRTAYGSAPAVSCTVCGKFTLCTARRALVYTGAGLVPIAQDESRASPSLFQPTGNHSLPTTQRLCDLPGPCLCQQTACSFPPRGSHLYAL